jgi:serine/threonine protein kinase
MLGAFGEVVVLDWGLAKAADQDASGAVAGTHGYMAPEQAGGGAVDHRADVYALGAILHELLANALPSSSDPAAAMRAAGVPRPLAAICQAALRRDPNERYQSVAAMRDDVARYRAGGAVSVYRETIGERIGRLGRTYRTAILLVLAYLVMRTLVALFARR